MATRQQRQCRKLGNLFHLQIKFSLDANVQNRLKSWELPEETMIATAQRERMRNRASTRMPTFTPLDRSLITKIKAVFSSANRHDMVDTTKSNPAKRHKRKLRNVMKRSRLGTKIKTIVTTIGDDDSDDDIFDDIDDYAPALVLNRYRV